MYSVSMKLSDGVTVTGAGESMAEAHEKLAAMAEIYNPAKRCGCCGKNWLRPVVRTDKNDNKYYEMWCTEKGCFAKFTFGQAKKPKGALFPQWKTKSGERKPNGGWTIYKKGEQPKTENENETVPF